MGDLDKLHEACGVFGVFAKGENVAKIAYFGILALQHRGQESAGIATSDGHRIKLEKQAGRVDRFMPEQLDFLASDETCIAISHNRYSNTGGDNFENFQPFVVITSLGSLALAHNGNLVNPDEIFAKLKSFDIKPKGTSDSELIALLIAYECRNSANIEQAIERALGQVRGSYGLVIITDNKLIGIRDPWGIRPLCLGRLNGSHYLLSSETCALEAVGGKLDREIEPGEMVVITEKAEPLSTQILPEISKKLCIFELIYFASPGSIQYDRLLQRARRHMGECLWKEHPVEVINPDEWIVAGIPDTGTPAAQGYADASGLEWRTIFIKNRYVGRTFIQPDQRMRELGVRSKLQVLGREVRGKKVIIVEDSIVRGTTSGQIVKMLFEAGAVEVHFRVTSPPYKYRCYMGIDTQYSGELIAAEKRIEEIREYIGADSLGYLSLDGVIWGINKEKYLEPISPDHFCEACFTGNYPFEVPTEQGRFELGR